MDRELQIVGDDFGPIGLGDSGNPQDRIGRRSRTGNFLVQHRVDGSFSDYRNSALRDQFKVSGTCLKERMIMIITNPIVSNIREAIKAKSCGDKPTCRNCDQMYVWIVLFPPWTSVVRIVSLNEMIA